MNCRNTTKSKDADKGRKANTSREANSRSDNSNSIMTPLETVGMTAAETTETSGA